MGDRVRRAGSDGSLLDRLKVLLRFRGGTAFVLSGGGNLGALQVGMLRALVERELVPDLVVGCSAGALNGAAFCADPSEAGVDRLTRSWTSITSASLMPSRLPGPLQLLRKGESLHSSDGLRQTVEDFLGPSRSFEDLVVPFQCVAADIEGSCERWFGSGDLVGPILASAALPAVFPLVEIDGRRYMDGGVVDNVPISRAVQLGASRIVVLHVGLHGRPNLTIKRPLDAALIGYWVARNARFARDLEAVPPDVEVLVVPIGERPELRYDDFSHTSDLVSQGYDAAAIFLDQWLASGGSAKPRRRIAPGARRASH